MFSKLVREITTAARAGGDPKMNMRLKTAIEEAKAVNMPADTLKRAIQKGTGELPGETYEEITYEGYGPGGVAVMVKVLTDNKNRTAPEIRHTFTKFSGNLGEVGSVGWMFDRKGIIQVEAARVDEDELLGLALDAGAADLRRADSFFEITATPHDLEEVRRALEGRGRADPVRGGDLRAAVDGPPRGQGRAAGAAARRGAGGARRRAARVRELRHPRRGAGGAGSRLRGMDEASIPPRPAPRAVGFDPGLADTGYAALEGGRRVPTVLGTGVIRTSARDPLEVRLEALFDGARDVLERFAPDLVIIEDIFSAPSIPRTAILMGHARAAVCLAGRRQRVLLVSVAPAEVKRAVTASGAAPKAQVARAMQALLALAAPPRPSHVADALALAYTGLSRARGLGGR